jgi:hypothetical protein
VAEPVDVGVGGAGAARGVDLVDLADVDPGALGQREDVGAQLARRQPLEPVEDRVEHDRPGVGDDHAERDHGRGARDPPAAAEAAHAQDQQPAARGGEERADRLRLGDVARPPEPALRD